MGLLDAPPHHPDDDPHPPDAARAAAWAAARAAAWAAARDAAWAAARDAQSKRLRRLIGMERRGVLDAEIARLCEAWGVKEGGE